MKSKLGSSKTSVKLTNEYISKKKTTQITTSEMKQGITIYLAVTERMRRDTINNLVLLSLTT